MRKPGRRSTRDASGAPLWVLGTACTSAAVFAACMQVHGRASWEGRHQDCTRVFQLAQSPRV